jgi:dienelactone hydrolase
MNFTYHAMAEEILEIPLPKEKGLHIKAILRGKMASPMVVMVHGLPGEGNELLQFLGARYLAEAGYNSLRLFLYSWDEGTRNLVDCTIETHADDFDTVTDYLKKHGVDTVFAEGHSYGGLTILRSRSKLNGAVLWDPSHGLSFQDPALISYYENNHTKEVDGLKLYLNGPGYIEPKAITTEQQNLGDNSSWAANKRYPLKIISAGDGVMVNLHKMYIDAADSPKQHSIISGAHHLFEDSDDVMFELFAQTAEWFKV